MDSCTPFAPRATRLLGVVQHQDWRVRCWSIAHSGPFDGARFDAGRRIALDALPLPAAGEERPGVGFLIQHQGNGADYVVLAWWDRENELPLRVFVRENGSWRPARGSESICVWDIEVIWGERQNYVRHVLAGGAPDLRAYLEAGR